MTNDLIPLSDISRMAQVAVQSKLFGIKTESEAMALMLIAQSEGMHPMTAVRQFHVIQGRAAMKSEAMLARFQAAGGVVEWERSDAQVARATFSHPAGGKLAVEWSIERAMKVSVDSWEGPEGNRRKTSQPLTSKDVWKNYPAAMLRARVISEGVRAVYPGCTLGLHSEEEVVEVSPLRSSDHEELPKIVVASIEQAVAEVKPAPQLCTREQAQAMANLAKSKGIIDNDEALLRFASDRICREVGKLSQLSVQEVALLVSELEALGDPSTMSRDPSK